MNTICLYVMNYCDYDSRKRTLYIDIEIYITAFQWSEVNLNAVNNLLSIYSSRNNYYI